MRRIPKIKTPKFIEKAFQINDFANFTQSQTNAAFTLDGLLATDIFLQNKIDLGDFKADKFYCANQKFFAFNQNDNGLYFLDGGEWVKLISYGVAPNITPIMVGEENCELILGNPSYLMRRDLSVEQLNIPYSSVAVKYKNRLFTALNNSIYFSKLNDYFNFTEGAGYIKTDGESGNILALIPTRAELVVVCEYGVYHLLTGNTFNGYKLIKQNVNALISYDSVKRTGNDIVLCAYNALFKLKNGFLTAIESKFLGNCVFEGQVCAEGKNYFAKVVDKKGNKYLYLYDSLKEQESFIQLSDFSLIDDGSCLMVDGKIKTIIKTYSITKDVEWQSVWLDFGSTAIKNLVGVEIRSNQPCQLEIECAYEKQNFNLDAGLNLVKTNLSDKKFRVKLKFSSKREGVEKLKFIYRVQED